MNNNYEIKLEKKKKTFLPFWGNVGLQCVVPENIHAPSPHGRSLEIPRGRGGSKAVIEG